MTDYVICYDICDPRRLARLARYLVKRAVRMQYSVFLFQGDDRQLERCIQGAAELIDPQEDDLRVYPLPVRGLKARLGRPILPEGILYSGLPSAW